MENKGVDIKNVELNDELIKVIYVNDAVEYLPKKHETYKKFNDFWLVNNPPFISDKYKMQMRDIILHVTCHNENCCKSLNIFFSSPNEDKVKHFFTYMRSRDTLLPPLRAKWT